MNAETIFIYKEGIELYSETGFNDWLHIYNEELNSTPFESMTTDDGIKKVKDLLIKKKYEKI